MKLASYAFIASWIAQFVGHGKVRDSLSCLCHPYKLPLSSDCSPSLKVAPPPCSTRSSSRSSLPSSSSGSKCSFSSATAPRCTRSFSAGLASRSPSTGSSGRSSRGWTGRRRREGDFLARREVHGRRTRRNLVRSRRPLSPGSLYIRLYRSDNQLRRALSSSAAARRPADTINDAAAAKSEALGQRLPRALVVLLASR